MKFDLYEYLPKIKAENCYLGVSSYLTALPYIKAIKGMS
jgi:hypothetical protein